jgi:hypothetical protein
MTLLFQALFLVLLAVANGFYTSLFAGIVYCMGFSA